MGKTLSNISSEATEVTNTTGVLTPILELQPEDGLVLILLNMVAKGDEAGIPIAARLQDSNENDLPLDSDFALGFEAPSDDDFTVVSEVRDNIEPYRQLSLKEQFNERFIDATKTELKGDATRLVARDVDTIYVLVDSSSQIDWSNSRLTINEKAVREVSEDATQG